MNFAIPSFCSDIITLLASNSTDWYSSADGKWTTPKTLGSFEKGANVYLEPPSILLCTNIRPCDNAACTAGDSAGYTVGEGSGQAEWFVCQFVCGRYLPAESDGHDQKDCLEVKQDIGCKSVFQRIGDCPGKGQRNDYGNGRQEKLQLQGESQ